MKCSESLLFYQVKDDRSELFLFAKLYKLLRLLPGIEGKCQKNNKISTITSKIR